MADPQANESIVNRTMQVSRNLFRPKRRENHALAGRTTALAAR
jgi:hypothetical protein